MKLETFMYANDIKSEIISGKKTQIINSPLLSLKPYSLPGQFSFSIIFGISDIDLEVHHDIGYILKPVDGAPVVDIANARVEPFSVDDRKNADGLIGSIDLRNVIFKTAGIYEYKLFIDGKLLKNDEIKVAGADLD